MNHDVKLQPYGPSKRVAGGGSHPTKFRGECSCGEKSPMMTTAGMVSQWSADHVNRQPELCRALVTASAQSVALFRGGKRIMASRTLRDARVMAQQLRVLLEPPYRDAEQLALDLFERARSHIEDGVPLPEEAQETSSTP